MRLIAAIFLLIASVCAANAQGCGSQNPNCIVPTAPVGTSNNQAASTQFVQQNVPGFLPTIQPQQSLANVGNSAAVAAGVYTINFIDPRNVGLVGDGSTDNTTAFNVMEATNNATIRWPAGTFCVNGAGTITGNFVRNVGVANQATVIKNCGSSNTTMITVTGGFPVIEHMQIVGLNKISSTHPTLYFNGSTHCLLNDVTVYYGFYAVQNNAGDCSMVDSVVSFAFQANFYSNNGAFYIDRTSFDSPQPYGTIPHSTAAWSSNASVSANAVLTVSGTPLQYSASCTTGGTAPTVVGYGLNITDGTCTAQIAGPLYMAYFDTGATVNFVSDSDFSGFSLNASIFSVSSSLSITNSTISGYAYGLRLDGGDQVTLDNVSISFSETSADGILANTLFTGDLSVTNGMFNNSPGNGVFLQGGANFNFANNRTSNLSSGGYGLGASGATHILSVNNNWGGSTGNPGGISLASTTDYFQSINDDLTNAGTAVSNSASGTHNLICFTAGISSTCSTLPSTGFTINSASFGLTGNITGSGIFGTSGIRYKNAAVTLSDSTSSGTIAANYDSVFGGSTLTATSSTTLTAEYGSYFKAPTCSTNVTCTSSFALGADSAAVVGGTLAAGANAINVTATQPASPTSGQTAVNMTITSAGTASQNNTAFAVGYNAGYTGANKNTALSASNDVAGTGGSIGTNNLVGNIGGQYVSFNTTTGWNAGISSFASNGVKNFGGFFATQVAVNSGANFGVVGLAQNTGTSPQLVGVLATYNSTLPSSSAPLIVDNASITAPIALFLNAGSTVASVNQTGGITATLTNVATTSAVCYNTSTGLLTYDGTIGTCNTSGRWAKNIIAEFSDAAALRAVVNLDTRDDIWKYKQDEEYKGRFDKRLHVGLIADDVAKMDPRCVGYKDDGRVSDYDERCVIAYLVGAIKQQQAEIEHLKRRQRN